MASSTPVASPPPSLPTRQGKSRPQKPPPRLTRFERLLVDPPPAFARPLLMLVLLVGLLAGAAWAGYYVYNGINLPLTQQRESNANSQSLTTSLIAQSFYCTRPNLDHIDLSVSVVPVLSPDGRVRLLEGDGLGGAVLYDVPLSDARFTQGIYLTIDFPPIQESQGHTYTVVVNTPGKPLSNYVGLRYNTFDTTPSGAMYTNDGGGKPEAGDVSFDLAYRYDLGTLWGDIMQTAGELRRLVLSPLLLLLLPGLALLLWLPNSLSPGQRLVAAPGLTALSLPIFYLITRALGLKIDGTSLWVVLGLCALLIVAGVVRWARKTKLRLNIRSVGPTDIAFWGLLVVILLSTLISRLISLRDQVTGMGLDAYHQTLISVLFVQSGGIPSNYLPYAPLSSFTYHFGFHSLAASIAWLSGRTSVSDMLTLVPQAGQIATTLPVLTLTLLGWKWLGNRWAGLAAGALAGVVCVIPAFYVNWSRYTEGLGLALLPLSWVLLMEVLDRPLIRRLRRVTQVVTSPPPPSVTDGSAALNAAQASPTPAATPTQEAPVTWQAAMRQSGPYMLAVIGAAGLALSHYRIAIIYAAFVALYIIWRTFRLLRGRVSLVELLTPLRRVVTVAVLAGATLLPWLLNLRQNFHQNVLNQASNAHSCDYYDISTRLGTNILNSPTLFIICALALGGIGWAIKRKDVLPLLPFVTWVILTAWSDPCLLPIPYDFSVRTLKAGYLDIVTVASGAWLPLCLMAGYTVVSFAGWIISLGGGYAGFRSRLWVGASALLVGAVVVLGSLALGFYNGPANDPLPYLAKGDLAALTWMRDNLPRGSRVLADPFGFPWSSSAVLGTDSGLWIPLVSGLPTTVPPMTAYNERLSDPNYLTEMGNIIGDEPLFQVDKDGHPLPTTADWNALKSAGYTNLYIGSRGAHFDKQFLFDHPEHATLVFHDQDTWVFSIR